MKKFIKEELNLIQITKIVLAAFVSLLMLSELSYISGQLVTIIGLLQ